MALAGAWFHKANPIILNRQNPTLAIVGQAYHDCPSPTGKGMDIGIRYDLGNHQTHGGYRIKIKQHGAWPTIDHQAARKGMLALKCAEACTEQAYKFVEINIPSQAVSQKMIIDIGQAHHPLCDGSQALLGIAFIGIDLLAQYGRDQLQIIAHPMLKLFCRDVIFNQEIWRSFNRRSLSPINPSIGSMVAGSTFVRATVATASATTLAKPVWKFRSCLSNARRLLILDSPIGLVAVLPIGMSQVSSVVMTANVGTSLRKGEEVAYFQFGGSDCIMLFEAAACVSLTAQLNVHYNQGTGVGLAYPA